LPAATFAEPAVAGTIAIGVSGHLPQIRWIYHDEPVPTQVVQDRDGLRAFLVPVTAGAAEVFAVGDHQLTLALDRARYATTAPPDAVSRYTAEAGVGMRI
jgi:hypothetical protein